MKIDDVLTINDSLNSKFWIGRHGEKQNSSVMSRLELVARDFFDDLDLEGVELEDITFTGSLANYNYTKYSDIDLHLLVDFSKIDENYDLVRNFFSAKTSNWNNKHNITVFGYEIEIYVQDISEDHHSTGVFSILKNQWIAQPNRIEPEIDEKMVKRKVKSFIDMIERVEDMYNTKKYARAHEFSKKLIKKIKKFRQSGLEEKGEYSYENLTFKFLRNKEHMKTLFDIRDTSYDKNMSLEGNFDKKFKIFIDFGELEERKGFNSVEETKDFQNMMKRRHNENKLALVGVGGRSESSPVGFGGSR
jgi:predicted nucleotidyltransferase